MSDLFPELDMPGEEDKTWKTVDEGPWAKWEVVKTKEEATMATKPTDNKQYWKKVTLEALDKALEIRDGFDTTDIYDWIDEINLRIKEIHRFKQDQLNILLVETEPYEP